MTKSKHATIPCVFSNELLMGVADNQMAVCKEFHNAMRQAMPAISKRSGDLAITDEGRTGILVNAALLCFMMEL